MDRHEFLRRLHLVVRPRTYLEIGVAYGDSLAVSRVRSIGVDPAYSISAELRCDVQLARTTSDRFFARPDPLEHFRPRSRLAGLTAALARRDPRVLLHAPRIDLAFIDGLHLFEQVLRDVTHVERHADWSSVIVLDDVLPRDVDEAARDRHTDAWTGDVFKITFALREARPDLVLALVDTRPTGLLVVLGADPDDLTLREGYGRLLARHVRPDPQVVPAATTGRLDAVDPEALLAADFWPQLVRARDRGRRRGELARLRPAIERGLSDAAAARRAPRAAAAARATAP